MHQRAHNGGLKMKMTDFIRRHRRELDRHIFKRLRPHKPRLNDAERRNWIENDEALYSWARAEGVPV